MGFPRGHHWSVLWHQCPGLHFSSTTKSNTFAGRQWSFNLTCLISAAFGLGLGGCSTYSAFLVVTAFNGFGIGGNIPIDTTICLEFIPQNRRFMLALLSIFQPIGVTICCAIAYGFIPNYSCQPDFTKTNPDGSYQLESCNISAPGQPCCHKRDNMGWRYLMFTLGSITLFIFFLRFVVFNFKESPKFLVYRGQDAKAIEVLQHVAKVNKRECGVTLQDFEALTAEDASTTSGTELFGTGDKQRSLSLMEKVKLEFVRYGMLFKTWQIARLTLLVWLIYICDFWGFSLAGKLPSLSSPNCQRPRVDNCIRLLSSVYLCREERRTRLVNQNNLPQLLGHLHAWYRRCCSRFDDVQSTGFGSPIHHADLCGADGRFNLCFLCGQHTACQHWPQHDGVVSLLEIQEPFKNHNN